MPKVKTRKPKKPELEFYTIGISNWEMSCSFGINKGSRLHASAYFEDNCLVLSGPLIYPQLKISSMARLRIWDNPALDDHWKQEHGPDPFNFLGSMTVTTDDNTLEFFSKVPSRSLQLMVLAVSAGKVSYASIWGTRLRYRQGYVHRVELTQNLDEE
jgi:hypothetical protein